MSASGDPPRRAPRRRLSREERALWQTVTRSVKPIRSTTDAEEADSAPPPDPTPQPTLKASPRPRKAAAPVAPKPASPPLAPLDRRLKQRVARGSAAIDARIDLHGMTQERAHHALLRFLRSAQADGAKLVLVITGKGARAAGDSHAERGVLRRLVPHWLALSEFRSCVIGFEAAHVTHGGEGALYVRVRSGRKH